MRCFGLTPDQVLARDATIDAHRFPSLAFSIVYGAVAMGVVLTLGYSIWAFNLIKGTAGLYAATALVMCALIGLALSRLVVSAGATGRFALLLGLAFLLYAIGWCAGWFGLRGRYFGDFWGALLGLAAMAFLLARAFEKRGGFLGLFLVLLLLHSVGYYLGGYLYGAIRGSTGRLLWGVSHGLGFGAGLGFVLFHVQSALKARLAAPRATATVNAATR